MAHPVVPSDDASRALSEAMRRGGQSAELFAERKDNHTIRLEGGLVAEVRSDRDSGAGLRVVAGGRTGFAYTNMLRGDSLADAARVAADSTLVASPANAQRIDLRSRDASAVQRTSDPEEGVESGQIVEILRRIDASARETSGLVTNVSITHVSVVQHVTIATSDGVLVTDQRVRTRATCRVTVRRDGATQSGFFGPGAGVGMELYSQQLPETIGRFAAERALRALDGVESPSGRLPVVLGSAGGGLLLHEACGHGLEGDGLSRDSSVYARTRGRQVGSPLVTAIDDPSLPLAYGSYGTDDEGTSGTPTTLLAEGIQIGALTDRATAPLLDAQLSGNGRRESYAQPPIPRMSNTFIANGLDDPADIISSVKHGVYVVGLKGGDVDTTTGEFGFTASEAYLIENGIATSPLADLTLLGNGPEAMSSIQAVGNDLSFTQALCGNDGQWVPVSYGSPTLLISGLTVTGRTS
jgi:TldD protein